MPAVTAPVDRFYAGKVTGARTRVDVPMLVLRGEWLKAIGFRIGAKAFLSTDKHGDHAYAHGPQAAAQGASAESEAVIDGTPRRLTSNDSLVLVVSTDPEPDDPALYRNAERAIVETDARRAVATNGL